MEADCVISLGSMDRDWEALVEMINLAEQLRAECRALEEGIRRLHAAEARRTVEVVRTASHGAEPRLPRTTVYSLPPARQPR
jgi:hypothetical protein